MNQQQKYILDLQRKPRERRKEKAFVIEGRKLFEEAPDGSVKSVIVSESFEASRAGAELLSGKRYSVVTDSIFETLSDTKTPQGIMAVISQPEYKLSQLLKSDIHNPLLLILEHIQDPGNLGTMMRAAEAAGVTGVIMSADCADIFNPKTIRSTMGSVFRVPFVVCDDMLATVGELKLNGVRIYAAHLDGSSSYDAFNYSCASAFCIGNESGGLSEALTALADDRIRIPMSGSVESLNAAMAATVLMFEAARQRRTNK